MRSGIKNDAGYRMLDTGVDNQKLIFMHFNIEYRLTILEY